MLFTVVDIETTGGSAQKDRIIDFAAILTDGKEIIDSYQTLINPERHIPEFITSLTGINDSMVEDAPLFSEVAARIDDFTKGKIFVAHSVNFDFSFVKNEFKKLGHHYDRKKLCTVRLSRKIFPGYRSYSLGKICGELGISISDRHRAYGDAEATAILLNMLWQKDGGKVFEQSLKQSSREMKLPPNIEKEKFDQLPTTAGVYYFFDQKGKIIYIGKAKNLYQRVSSHFTISGSLGEKNNFVNKIFDLDFVETGNEMIALLLESSEIKKHWPEFNRSQKVPTFSYGLYEYFDSRGYRRFSIAKTRKGMPAIRKFASVSEGKKWLYERVDLFQLCPKLCGLQPAKEECFNHKIGKCGGACVGKIGAEEYNKLVEQAFSHQDIETENYAILGNGRNFGEKSVVLIENGIYQGFGYIDQEDSIENVEQLRDRIEFQKETPEVKSIIKSFLNRENGFSILEM